MKNRPPTLSSLITPQHIACHLTESTCWEAGQRLIALMRQSDESLANAEIDRLFRQRTNGCGVTLLLPEVAVIHTRGRMVPELRTALGTSERGIRCAGAKGGLGCPVTEGESIKLIALILAPADDTTGCLRVSAALASICRQEGFLSRLLAFADPMQAWKWLQATGQRLPEHVAAQDIMIADYPRLRDSDTLSDAIDAFCYFGVSELPVVDEDGDLVGVVSEDELIKMGLPDYITWMEDLSPIMNFEPFVEILRREDRVPIFEIMAFADRYATIDEASPAILAAKLMIRRELRQIYVTQGKKLAGVIVIHDFMQKVLRA